MPRAMCSKTSKRKHTIRPRDVSVNLKENASSIQSKASKEFSSKKQVKTHSTTSLSFKENAVGNTLQNSKSPNNRECNVRKSERHRKSSYNTKDFIYNKGKCEIKTDTSTKRNVLSDKTNSPLTGGTKISTQSESLEEARTKVENKSVNVTKSINVGQCNENREENANSKSHIPVYKTLGNTDTLDDISNLTLAKKEAVYEFDEVDENEEPAKKRKKKKRPYAKKVRIGPKALTINNIKYSSSESLVSLPEKPVRQKKIKPKGFTSYTQSISSVNNFNDTKSTCCSAQSFISHPPSSFSHDNKEFRNKHELSVLQETQSENCLSPIHESPNNLCNVVSLPEMIVSGHLNSNSTSVSSVLPGDPQVPPEYSVVSHQRSYPSKKSLSNLSSGRVSQCGTIIDTSHNQLSHSLANISRDSSHEFLSSTPCKKTSLVVRSNSVFSDSYETEIPNNVRPSTGFIKELSENMVVDDKCFGFDTPEELEEPLLSPIKNINLPEPKILTRRHEFFRYNEIELPTFDPKEVIEKLKATLPKTKTKESSDIYGSESFTTNDGNKSSPISKEVETTLSFTKPPRRSYERQRRVRYHSEHDEDEEETSDSQQEEEHNEKHEEENVPKANKKCYQKKNVSRVFKAPQVPKAKQKILKEEEELERLAAQLNAQFQEIEKCNLVVE